MAKNDYVPTKDAAKLTWAQNLETQAIVTPNLTAMGWSTAQASEVAQQADNIVQGVLAKETAKQVYKAAVAAADALIRAALQVIRPRVVSGKALPSYTPAVGQLLGVIGEGTPFDPNAYVGELKGLKLLGSAQVEVSFGKASGDIDGVDVYMRRQGQAAWVKLGLDTESPYTDTTPLAAPGVPEVREYRVTGVLHDLEIGTTSPTQQITVT